ncbi:rod shape-determining protein MreC [Anaerolentibacter hominis]|uniref:rod shape-determining protein MreC n=1 Tax=Anaerolentibacter hominis TaxID=3079009 RepID=UPI0031B87D1C
MKRRKKLSKFSITAKYLFIACSVLCVILIVVSFKYEQKFDSVRSAVEEVFAPVQKGIHNIGEFFSGKVQYFQKLDTVLKENETLQQQLDEMSAQNQILIQEKYELESLRKLYKLDQTYGDYPKVAARVVGNNMDNWFNSFLIDKGSSDGLTEGMNVIAGNGLVGIITNVSEHYSRVRSIIDDKSYVGASFQKTQDRCMVYGNLSLREQGVMELEVEMIDKDAEIKEGYELVTSNISDKFLPGILIGYLSDFTVDSSNMTMSGHVTPAVDFSNLDTVLVITVVKDSEELNQMLNEE